MNAALKLDLKYPQEIRLSHHSLIYYFLVDLHCQNNNKKYQNCTHWTLKFQKNKKELPFNFSASFSEYFILSVKTYP